MKKSLINIVIALLCVLIGFGAGVLATYRFMEQKTPVGVQGNRVTVTPVPTNTLAPTQTLSPSPTATNTPTPTNTPIITSTPTPTAMSTPTLSPSPVPTNTPIPTSTPTPTVTSTPTPSPSPVPTNTPTPTSTPTPTVTSTPTPTNTPTPRPTATSTPTPTPSPSPTPVWTEDKDGFYGALHVEGSHLFGEDGSLVQLRGVSTHGLGWFPGYVNEAMIAQVRQDWGCNVFRLAMYTAESNGYCTSGSAQKENLKKLIDTGVKAAVQQEMYVIIDWHILSDGSPAIYKDEAKKFFAEMAKKYKDVPNVIYEICNEPNGRGDWATIKAYALEIIPIIREYAPEAIIIVGTPTWSQDVDVAAKDPITGYDNIMYALHFYADTHRDNLREKCTTAVKHGLPLFVSEYGICDASGNGAINEKEAEKWIDLLDGYGISHVMWNLSNKSETCAMIKSSCSKTQNLTNGDLSPTGRWFLNMMGSSGTDGENLVVPEPIVTPVPQLTVAPTRAPEENAGNEILTAAELFELPDNLEVKISGNWPTAAGQAYQFDVVVKNTGAAEETDWIRELVIKEGQTVTVSQSWCTKVTAEGTTILLTPEEYNKTIPAGGEVSGIGIIVEVRK